MSSISTTIVLATVIAVQGPSVEIDSGALDGLIEGVKGEVFYELTVAGEARRIDVGTATIVHAGESSARVAVRNQRVVYPGQQVEFAVPVETEPIVSDPEPTEPAPPLSVDESTAPPVEATEDWSSIDQDSRPNPVVPPVISPPIATTRILAGSYEVGLDRVDAEFFNQTPRFTTEIASYRIDSEPATDTSGAILRGLTFDAAERHCIERGARLPTEYEWETAVQQGPFEISEGLLEWTTSWYQPYPGNQQSEAEYGQLHRVLRGSPAGSAFSPYARRFLAPDRRNGQVGFRCVEEDR